MKNISAAPSLKAYANESVTILVFVVSNQRHYLGAAIPVVCECCVSQTNKTPN